MLYSWNKKIILKSFLIDKSNYKIYIKSNHQFPMHYADIFGIYILLYQRRKEGAQSIHQSVSQIRRISIKS